jgi:hypothetical protein
LGEKTTEKINESEILEFLNKKWLFNWLTGFSKTPHNSKP